MTQRLFSPTGEIIVVGVHVLETHWIDVVIHVALNVSLIWERIIHMTIRTTCITSMEHSRELIMKIKIMTKGTMTIHRIFSKENG